MGSPVAQAPIPIPILSPPPVPVSAPLLVRHAGLGRAASHIADGTRVTGVTSGARSWTPASAPGPV